MAARIPGQQLRRNLLSAATCCPPSRTALPEPGAHAPQRKSLALQTALDLQNFFDGHEAHTVGLSDGLGEQVAVVGAEAPCKDPIGP